MTPRHARTSRPSGRPAVTDWNDFLRDDDDQPAGYVLTSTVQEYLELLESFGGEGPVLDAATTTSASSDGGSRVETDAPAVGADVVVVAPSDEEVREK